MASPGRIAAFLLLPFLYLSFVYAFAYDFKSAMAEADAYLNNGQYLEAVSAYRTLSESAADPEIRAKSILMIGDIYGYFLNDPDRALEKYAMVKKQYPRSPYAATAYFNTGMLLYEKNQYREALAQFKTYVDDFPQENRVDSAIFMMEACSRPPTPQEEIKAVTKMPAEVNIRVLLMTGARDIRIEAPVPFEVRDIRENGTLVRTKTTTVGISGKQIKVNGKGPVREGLLIMPGNGSQLRINGTPYRGSVKIQKGAKGYLDVINILPLEAYLYGVVPKEISPQWYSEALKAQAVASRTYARYLIEKNKNRDYDVAATNISQVYGGAAVEAEKSTMAVDETKGLVLLYNNQPVLAYFHANSGGMTEDVQQVWAAEIPYLKSVPDDYSLRAPGCAWEKTFSLEEIRKALNKQNMDLGDIEAITPEDRSPSGRFTKIRILHDGRETILSGNDFRLKIDPNLIKSTNFQMTRQDQMVHFTGRGFGHGVGMSQWGAYIMAQEGLSYRHILQYYYQGVEIGTPTGRGKALNPTIVKEAKAARQ